MHSASAELIELATIGRQWSQKKNNEVQRIQQFDQTTNKFPNAPAPLKQTKKIALHHHVDRHHQRKT